MPEAISLLGSKNGRMAKPKMLKFTFWFTPLFYKMICSVIYNSIFWCVLEICASSACYDMNGELYLFQLVW